MSRYEDGYPSRGRAADYYTYSAGGAAAAAAPPPYPHTASPGHTTYNGQPQARLTYEPHASESHSRPRSLAPPVDAPRDKTRGRSDSEDSHDGKTRSPIGKAKRFVDNTFTDSAAGLGVGVLGALVGGLAAREAVELTSNREKQHKGRDDEEHKRNQLIGTVVGAAVGALGANAQEKWERKWRRPDGEPEVLEKMEVVARPRSRARSRGSRRNESEGSHDDEDWGAWDDRDGHRGGRSSSRHGIRREVDPGARSWRNVEDWVLDDGDSDDGRHRSGRHRSRDY
ncbi:hypothetical protein GQX73_g8512 [Xylaria multiplex]|uniref:Uncharacterized protein n=1 Tax=Xylaria multiplex TaxID=323545 RepID=A0A7C8MNU9_9PEZI|nr:hypothetical protein GQX73_g8512 [Xylaria multiplex]